MVDRNEFIGFAAGVFGVPPEGLSLETTYASIPEWDSMVQLRLVTETAARYGVEIPFAEVTNVTSLWEFLRRVNGGPVKKVVAVDLDNTLWDGVIGEDGPDAVRPNIALQTELKALKDRGVLLVALSKNNLSDVEDFLKDFGFVSWRVDWKSKPENLVSVARELNLGVDSFVFVDDNPVERLEMAARLPDVTVADFPPNLEAYFPPRELTEEDRRKTEEYRAEASRKEFLRDAGDLDVWTALGIELDAHELREEEVARVAQLSQKANQFNVCTNRYSEASVRELGRTGLVVTARTKDRFGDQGLVAYVVVKDGAIRDWVMSCRVMGRGIEERVEAEVERLAALRGWKTLSATWRASGRNEPVRTLFDRFGFTSVSVSETEKRYTRSLRG